MNTLPQRPKLVFISHIATPQQIKFCEALRAHIDAEFWFYESAERTRGHFWSMRLGQHCRVLEDVWFRKSGLLVGRYISPGLSARLSSADPDILMLGGFSIPSNYIAYRWARKNRKRIVVFTERSRNRKGRLRKWGFVWSILRWLYRDVDMVMVSAEDIVPQFRDDFRFGDRVVAGRYAADLDRFFSHAPRVAKTAYTYLFPNRMTAIYNPFGVLEIFAEINRQYPGSRLLLNAAGELIDQVREQVQEMGLCEMVEFLTAIPSWEHLHEVYAQSDIMLLPAHFSNGNFTLLEAMASGMGIVISDQVLGVGNLIQDGHNGFRCPPTTAAFIERVERYIENPSLFATHMSINRPLVAPLSSSGTAQFFSEKIQAFFFQLRG
jgi:glycosyltransferase involved in cell wall biosynthesis